MLARFLGSKGNLIALSLGCGTGALERELHRYASCAQVDAFDISNPAVRQAKEAAAREGLNRSINYRVADLNAIELPKEYYVIFSNSCLHHIRELEHLLKQCARAMKSGAYFIANGYVGPSRFQFPSDQARIIDDLLVLLPMKYKRRRALAPDYKLRFCSSGSRNDGMY